MSFSQEELDQLTACPKVVVTPPRRDMVLKDGSCRNDMLLKSADEKHRFSVFIRKNAEFAEAFSIGLEYLPADGTPRFALLRCNGPHGHTDDFTVHPHYDFHIHRASALLLEAGEEPLRNQEKTESYGSFEQALHYFLEITNIQHWETYFPLVDRQTKLFPEPGEA